MNYEQLKAFADKLRAGAAAANPPREHPEYPREHIALPSTAASSTGDKKREIQVQLHRPGKTSDGQRHPVVLNFPLGGFVIPVLGLNAPFCHRLAQRLDAYVLDVGYAKGPEHPFPAALEDAADAMRWALAQSWCDGRLALTGWSAGGNIAIALAAPSIARKYGLSDAQADAVKAAAAVYPVTSLDADRRDKSAGNKSSEWLSEHGIPGHSFPRQLTDTMASCYLLGTDPAVAATLPEANPLGTPRPASVFTKPLTLVTAEYDGFREEGEAFAAALQADGHKDVRTYLARDAGHAWEASVPDADDQMTADVKGALGKKEAYALIESRLREAFA